MNYVLNLVATLQLGGVATFAFFADGDKQLN